MSLETIEDKIYAGFGGIYNGIKKAKDTLREMWRLKTISTNYSYSKEIDIIIENVIKEQPVNIKHSS